MATTVYNRKLSARQLEQLRNLRTLLSRGIEWATVWRGSHQWRTCESLARRGLVSDMPPDEFSGSSACSITQAGLQALAAAEAGRAPTDPLR